MHLQRRAAADVEPLEPVRLTAVDLDAPQAVARRVQHGAVSPAADAAARIAVQPPGAGVVDIGQLQARAVDLGHIARIVKRDLEIPVQPVRFGVAAQVDVPVIDIAFQRAGRAQVLGQRAAAQRARAAARQLDAGLVGQRVQRLLLCLHVDGVHLERRVGRQAVGRRIDNVERAVLRAVVPAEEIRRAVGSLEQRGGQRHRRLAFGVRPVGPALPEKVEAAQKRRVADEVKPQRVPLGGGFGQEQGIVRFVELQQIGDIVLRVEKQRERPAELSAEILAQVVGTVVGARVGVLARKVGPAAVGQADRGNRTVGLLGAEIIDKGGDAGFGVKAAFGGVVAAADAVFAVVGRAVRRRSGDLRAGRDQQRVLAAANGGVKQQQPAKGVVSVR